MADSKLSIDRFEDRGYFLELTFDKEEEPTVLFVADRDFESLRSMCEDESNDWETIRNEIFELLDHSGHEADHQLGRETTQQIRDSLLEFTPETDTTE